MADLPYSSYARIKGQMLLSVADTTLDPDKYPDGVIPTGFVTLTPNVVKGFLRFPISAQVVVPKPIKLALDSAGHIVLPSAPTDREVYVPPTDQGNPSGWTYTVSFAVKDPEGNDLPIESYSVQVIGGETTDIFNSAPVASGGGVLTRQGPAGFSQYELAYQERTTDFTLTTTGQYNFVEGMIPGLALSFLGTGREVEIRLWLPNVRCTSTAGELVIGGFLINGSGTNGAAAFHRSPRTSDGDTFVAEARVVFAKDQLIQVQPYLASDAVRTVAFGANSTSRAFCRADAK